MKARLPLMLVLAALIGLFAQQAAYAAGPAMLSGVSKTTVMGDCAMAMDDRAMPPHQMAKKPCKGLTLGCIAAMGCVVPLAQPQGPTPIVRVALTPIAPTLPVVQRLHGIASHPEPDPPIA